MPVLGNALDFSQYEGKQFRAHQLGTAPVAPVRGQLYYNTANDTLWWWDGTAWQSAKGGAPDATASVKGLIQLAGDLAGTAASPQIAAGVITDTDVNSANKDGADATPGMRSLGYTTGKAMPGVARLDQIAAPASSVNFGSQNASNILNPISAQDAATKFYVDNFTGAVNWKAPVRVVTTANITLSGTQTINGVALIAGDRVLVKDQATLAQNGIYVVASGAWSRAGDSASWAKLEQAVVIAEIGTTGSKAPWLSSAVAGGTLDTTAITWNMLPGGMGLGNPGYALPNTITLDQIASANPVAANVSLNSKAITNLADPGNAQDAATKNYVDALTMKRSVKAASTANLTLTGTTTLDGVSVIAGDRVLVKNQTTSSQNGIYTVAAGAWSRSQDADSWTDLVSALVVVEQGTVNADAIWLCLADQGGTIGTTSNFWQQVPGGLGFGASQALPGNVTLDQIAQPQADVNMNNQTLLGLPDPSVASQAATKNYVDNTTQGLDAKASVKAASTANLTLSGTQTVDGIALVANDRILVKDQTTPAQNGIYVVAAGAWTRAGDANVWTEIPSAYVWVEQGTVNADTGWVSTADQGGTLGTTNITWVQFAAAGAAIAGAGLTKTGNTFDVVAGDGSLTVSADAIVVATNGITGAHLANGAVDLAGADVTGILPTSKGGTGRNSGTPLLQYNTLGPPSNAASMTIPRSTHGLNAGYANMVQVMSSTGVVELPDISIAANGDVTITWGATVTANSKMILIVGA